jgi:serine/threonine protein kinase
MVHCILPSLEIKQDAFPKFTKEEVKLGKVLGKGGFGTVYEVRGFNADGSSSFGSSSRHGLRSSPSLKSGSDAKGK